MDLLFRNWKKIRRLSLVVEDPWEVDPRFHLLEGPTPTLEIFTVSFPENANHKFFFIPTLHLFPFTETFVRLDELKIENSFVGS